MNIYKDWSFADLKDERRALRERISFLDERITMLLNWGCFQMADLIEKDIENLMKEAKAITKAMNEKDKMVRVNAKTRI